MHELFLHYSLIKNVLLVQSNFGALDLILFGGLLRSAVCNPCFGGCKGSMGILGELPLRRASWGLKNSSPPTAPLFSVP